MIYLTASVWLAIVVLLAWGVHHIWCGLSRPRTVNLIIFPGTLVAQLGRVLGLLITGATMPLPQKPEKPAEEDADPPAPQPRLPVIGPVIVGLTPMLGLGLLIYVLCQRLGDAVVSRIPAEEIPQALPLTLAGMWEQLRSLITLCEATLNALREVDTARWRIVLFSYLMVSLTVRLAPFHGNLRGHVGAVAVLGMLAVLTGSMAPGLPDMIASAWPCLCLTVGWLLLLLFASLIAKATVHSARRFMKWE